MSRILMVSPHPTYSPRGTPISVFNRCCALAALGHEIDLVTYGIGEDVPVPGLRYLRAPVPGIRTVRVGPSLAKIPLNLAVFFKTIWILLTRRRNYDVLHTHEEAGPLGAVLSKIFRIPHAYDMGNDLDVVLGNYGLGQRHLLRRFARWVENVTIRSAGVVLAHFPALTSRVHAAGDTVPCQVIFNVPLKRWPDLEMNQAVRRKWVVGVSPVVFYVGTFEAYQGLDLLLDAMVKSEQDFQLVLAGGSDEQQKALRERAVMAGIGERVVLLGRIPSADVPLAMASADVLVSPRAVGTNTPLKIFEYLHSGRPIVATAIESHTEVLDERVAILVPATPEGLAAGLDRAVLGGAEITQLATAARHLAEQSYSANSYVESVAAAYAHLGVELPVDLDSAIERMVAQS